MFFVFFVRVLPISIYLLDYECKSYRYILLKWLNKHMHESAQHIPPVIKALEPALHNYGYLAVGGLLFLEDFGVPVPGETTLVAAAFYAGLGQLNIFLIIIIGILGAILGDNLGYCIGKFGGHPLVEKFGKYIFLTPERINKAEAFFKKRGGKIVIVARFIEGLRQANGIIAGLSEMHWLKFVIFNLIGAVAWVSVWVSVGYFGGSHIETFLHYQLYFSITCLVLLFAYITRYFIKKRNKANA
jgi:membrane protein DedA with SNARE-associated domain